MELNLNNEIKLLFFRLIEELKISDATYIYRYPPDKEWTIDDFYHAEQQKISINKNVSVHFSHQTIDCFRLGKTLTNILNRKISSEQLYVEQMSEKILHPNIQIIIVLICPALVSKIPEFYISQLCIQFLNKYINRVIDESNDSIVKLLSKLRTPINEIISMPSKQEVVKNASIGIAVIINDLVDLYKLKKNKLHLSRKEFDFRKFIHELNDTVEFKLNIDEAAPNTIYADQRRLKQILMNLISSDTIIYITSEVAFDLSDEGSAYKIEFNIENIEVMSDERVYITKKLISLMNGSMSIMEKDARVTIRVFKDRNGFSAVTLKRIKEKKVLIIDESRQQEIANCLIKWGMIIVQSQPADLIIVNVHMLEKIINQLGVPYLILTDLSSDDSENTSMSTHTPRARPVSISKTNIFNYHSNLNEIELISAIMDII